MPIEAQGQFAVADIWRGNLLLARDMLIISTLLGGILVAYAVLGFVLESAGWINHVLVLAIGLLLPTYVWTAAFIRSRRTLSDTPNLRGTVQYEFDDGGFRVLALHSSGETKWTAILKWKEGKHVFLLYRAPKIAEIIPKRFFKNPADVKYVRNLLEKYMPR